MPSRFARTRGRRQRGGVLNDPATLKRRRNGNNGGNNGNAGHPAPPQPAPVSAFERALHDVSGDILPGTMQNLYMLLAAEPERSVFPADIVAEMATKSAEQLLLAPGTHQLRYETPQQREAIAGAVQQLFERPWAEAGDNGRLKPDYTPLHRLQDLDVAPGIIIGEMSFPRAGGALRKHLLPKWEGWSSGDAEKLDTVFEPEYSENYTACPVCMRSAERIEACNYMSHNCTALPGFYHQRLYEMYKDVQGMVHWCTICGRIAAKAHRHYKLARAQDDVLPATLPATNVFARGVCHQDGGGDHEEKVARCRRLREFALELQEEVGKISDTEAQEQMVEEMWNAPLVRSRAATRVAAEKKWNIPSDRFPQRKASDGPAPEVAAGPAPDVRKPVADAALTPVRVLQTLNAWSREQVAEGVRFVHRKTDGTVNAHEEGDAIGVDSLAEVLQARLAARGAPDFGFCWAYPSCSARLYPEDVQPFVPADLYEAYRATFNEKFRGAAGGRRIHGGGHEEDLLQPLVDGQCALPARGGGRRPTRRRRQQSKHNR